jgi:hypothetical protein
MHPAGPHCDFGVLAMMPLYDELLSPTTGVLKVVYRLSYNDARCRLRDGLCLGADRSRAGSADEDPPMPLEWAEAMWRGIEDALAFRPPAL